MERKKIRKKLQKQKIVKGTLAVFLGIYPFCAPPGFACASETGTPHYIDGVETSDLDNQNAFLKVNDGIVKSSETTKMIALKDGNTNQTIIIDGITKNFSRALSQVSGFIKSKDQNKYYVLALTYFDAANGVNKKIAVSYAKGSTGNNRSDGYANANSLYSDIVNAIFNDASVQKEFYEAIAEDKENGNTNKQQEVLAKYLPKFELLETEDDDTKSILDGYDFNSKDEFDFANFNNVNGANVSVNWVLDANKDLSSGEKTYSYADKQTVAAGGLWKPSDRALVLKSAYDGDYTTNSKWTVGIDGSITPTDISTIPGLDFSGGTAIANKPVTVISVKELETGVGSTIDLSFANTDGKESLVTKVGDTGTVDMDYTWQDSGGQTSTVTNTVYINRYLLTEMATLGNDTTLRLGVYKNGAQDRLNDTVLITTADQATADVGGKTNLNIQLGWVPEIKEESMVGSWAVKETINANGDVSNPLLGIYNNAEAFQVTAQESEVEGIFSKYLVLPDIGQLDGYYTTDDENVKQGTVWYLKGYTYADTGELAESGKSLSENSTVGNNFVKAANMSMFRRSESLHDDRLNRHETGGKGPGSDVSGLEGEMRENMWADVWHGKFDAAAGYARNTNQTYNGFQIGYDKLLHKKFYGGKVYTGFYASKLDGKSTTTSGKGEQDAYGIGVYSSWVGDKGHFIDLGVNATKIKNDFHFTGNTGNGSIGKVKGENSTWAYGIGAQYGKRNELSGNWYWEPSVSLYVGHVDESSYKLTNGLGVHEQGYDTAIGRLGLKAGKNIGDKGNLYAGVSWGHEFAAGQKLHQTYGALDRLVETVGGNDSWWEWNVGGKVKISSNGTFNLDFVKTTGSDVGNEWSINGGLDFSWGGFSSGSKVRAAGQNIVGAEPGFAKAQAPTVVVGKAPQVDNVQVPQMQQAAHSVVSNETGPSDADVYDMGEVSSNVVADNTDSVSGSVTDGVGEFELGGLTVEAKRPDWEKNLSPGQVSVIYPKQFEGEQKNLPELLDRVPGLFVQRVNGAGHYTVARVRGSTAAQVSVYVDGVQMNLTGDAAVNLSAIPADNIERIEVYRGYVPSRFAGAPLGGVINIITKRPSEGHGHITQGVKSYGGYSSTYEYSMPLGSGSLMATYARDIWQGDFDYTVPGGYNISTPQPDKTFKRRSNGYQNNNGLIKWQDDHWTVKGVWKKQSEELAKAITGAGQASPEFFEDGWMDGKMDIDYKEFMVGRRDTFGNLDLGWHLAYMDSKKTYTNTGGYKQMVDTEGTTHPIVETDFSPGQLWGTYHSKKWNSNLNLALKAGGNHLLEFNGDFTRETMDTNGNNWGAKDDHAGVGKYTRQMLHKYNNREYHLTLQDTITLNDDGDFKLTPILRADKVEMEGLGSSGGVDDRWMYSGGVALQKQLNDQWSIKSTWGTYNRHPNFYEIFGDGGFIRPNYLPLDYPAPGVWETGSQFDFSVNWQGKIAQADTSTILTWYQRKAKNQLVLYTPRGGNGLSCYVPTGEIKSYGIELAHNMKWKRLNLGLAATWQKSEELAGGLPWYYNWSSTGSSFVPEWVVSARLDYLFPGDKLNVFGEYRYTGQEVLRGVTSGDVAEASEYRYSYSIFDLGVKYKFDKSWRLSAGVNDVFNKGQAVFIDSNSAGGKTVSYYPLAGRMYYTTLEYSF